MKNNFAGNAWAQALQSDVAKAQDKHLIPSVGSLHLDDLMPEISFMPEVSSPEGLSWLGEVGQVGHRSVLQGRGGQDKVSCFPLNDKASLGHFFHCL